MMMTCTRMCIGGILDILVDGELEGSNGSEIKDLLKPD
jgi:hypothetical protein